MSDTDSILKAINEKFKTSTMFGNEYKTPPVVNQELEEAVTKICNNIMDTFSGHDQNIFVINLVNELNTRRLKLIEEQKDRLNCMAKETEERVNNLSNLIKGSMDSISNLKF